MLLPCLPPKLPPWQLQLDETPREQDPWPSTGTVLVNPSLGWQAGTGTVSTYANSIE
jgi:hypothetical protein